MSGVNPGTKSIQISANTDGRRSHLSFWKYLANIFAVASILSASVTTFWWFDSANAFAAAGPQPSALLSQCTNGTVGPPIAAEPCVGSNAASVSAAIPGINGGVSTSYKNWVNGNANGQKSHWSEGEYISYRALISGINSGTTHTLVFHYDTINSGLHAIDYLGSYNATETSGTSPTSANGQVVNANNNNPCADLVAAGTFAGTSCSPSNPQGTKTIPAVQFTGPGGQDSCDGAPGTFVGTQGQGAMALYGPAGSTIENISYLSQNVLQGTGTCTTTVQVSFTVSQNISSSQSIVLAWGGHIASELDWGTGSAASSINGSPFHMSLDFVDGSSTGSQDRALSSSAIYFAPTLATVVNDDGSPVTGTISIGSTVNDTATLTGGLSTASGSVDYLVYSNLTCSGGTPISQNQVNVTNGSVPPSPSFVPTAGSYSYQASYSGDSKDLSATSPCEPFVVGEAAPTISTIVYDASINQPLTDPIAIDAMVYDTATITHSGSVEPTGTVTYTFYSGGNCTTGSVVGTPQNVTINPNGTVPNSGVHGPLTAAAGPYAFKATYSGDNNYISGASDCEPFSVGQGAPAISTTIYNTSTNLPLANPLPINGSVYDTAAITHSGSVEPTGTVTYTFYSGGNCTTGSVVGTPQNVTINPNGTVPNSGVHGPLTAAAGPYAFLVTYSGDGNYSPGASDCEPFSVGQGDPLISTTIFNAATNQTAGRALPLGSTVYDTASLSNFGSVTPTGTVTYTFYRGGSDCQTGNVVSTYDVTLGSNGAVPNSPSVGPLSNSAGPYAYSAHYAGDANYVGSYSSCEPLQVEGIPTDSVMQTALSVSTTVYDASNNLPAGDLANGSIVYDTAKFTNLGSATPTGTVTYTFFSGGNCVNGTKVGTSQVVTVGAQGTVPSSGNRGPLTTVGSPYAFQASYSGDLNYQGGTSACEPFVVGPTSLTITTSLSATTTSVGSPVYDTARLQGESSSAGGNVTYSVYSNSSCTTFIQNISTVAVSSGQVPNSGQVSFSSPGTYYFQAYYTGDGNNTPDRSLCTSEALTVTPVPIGGAQTGVAPSSVTTANRLPIILLFGGGIMIVLMGVLVSHRRQIFRRR